MGCFYQTAIHLLQRIVDRVYHERQEVVDHTEYQSSFAQRQVEEIKQCHRGKCTYQDIHPHRQDEQHDHGLGGVEAFLAENISSRITEQKTCQSSNDGYSDGVDECVDGFGMHHEFAEVGKRECAFSIGEGIDHNEQQGHYNKDNEEQCVRNCPVPATHKETGYITEHFLSY